MIVDRNTEAEQMANLLQQRIQKAVQEIMSVYDITVPRGRGTPKNGIARTMEIIISENLHGVHRG